jgi:hypothetical protein
MWECVFVRLRGFLVVLALLIAGWSSLAQAQKGNASLHGIVIVPSGAPVSGATIAVEGKGGAQAATTDLNGEFNMSGLNPGSYSVKITAPGFDPFEVQVTVTGEVVREVDAVLMATPKPLEAPQAPAEAPGAAPASSETQGQTPGAAPSPTSLQPTVGTPQSFSVAAQSSKAAIYGNVVDQTGAVIQSGSATATGSGGTVTASINGRGQYVLNGLSAGSYKLSVSVAGFAPFETELTVAANQAVEIDATLQPQSAKTEVNVEAANAAQVETQSAHIEGTITEKEVLETGLNGRNFTQLIALAPGVSNQTGQDEAKVGVAGSVKYSVNGGRVEYNNFDVDGSDVLNAGLNGAESTLMVYPSLDAIQEVKVLTSNYGAEYGRTASGTVLVTTKSGTPQFHGGAYEFLRNEFFNARNYFDPLGKAPLYRRQDFGFTLGGPLTPKNKKTFFFWSEEFRLENSPIGPSGEEGDFNQAVPTVAERGGNFNDVCPFELPGQAAPFHRQQWPDCPAASYTGIGDEFNPYAGNQLGAQSGTTANLNSNSVTLMNALIPLPNSTIGCNSSHPQSTQPLMDCYVAAISPATYWREELGRVDHDFTPGMRASFRYIHDSWDTTTTIPQWGYLQTAAIHEQSFPTVENQLNGPGISMVARLTNTLSPTLLNEFVVSYVDSNITLRDISGPGGNLQATVARSGSNSIGSIFPYTGNKLPGIVIGGSNAAYGGNGFAVDTSYPPWQHTNPTYSLSDNLSKAIGKHTVQLGIQVVDARRSETNGAIGAATGDLQGLLSFSNLSTNGSGNAFADFLGMLISSDGPNVTSFQQDSAQLKYYNNYWIAEPYVQDDWRVNRRLTVNLGVRLSLFGNYHEENLNAYNWEQSAFNTGLAATVQIAPVSQQGFGGGNLLVGGQPVTLPLSANSVVTNGLVQCGKNGIPDSCMSSHLFNPAPRVGFAWDVKGDGKTSIRGGYGLFYEHGTAKEANTGSLEGSAPLVLTMTQPNPAQGYTGIGGGVAFPIDVTAIPTKTVWPYAQQWSFSIQRQLPKDMVGTVAYVGSKGTHLSAELQLNQLTPPPTGPDTGIFLDGNPFSPGQPITAQICQTYTGTVNATDTAYTPGSFTVGNIIVNHGEPAWTNLAAACYGDNPGKIPLPSSLRTFAPGMGRVLSLENIADSQYHALQATIRRTRGPLTVGASYTYSHNLDDSSDRSDASFVNSANIKSSWASSNFDQRHSLSVNYIYAFPQISGALERALSHSSDDADAGAGTNQSQRVSAPQSDSRLLHTALDGWEFSGITVFQSGTPFSVINGGGDTGISVPDNAGVANGSGSGSYPDVIGDPRAYVSKSNVTGSVGPLLYNPAAFAAPQGLTFGDAGRNFLNNPHRLNFDMTMLKHFKVTENSQMEFRIELFNAFNHTEFRIFNPNLGNTASNTIGCYAGPNNSAAGGLTPVPDAPLGTPPVNIDCTTGSGLFHPVDAHRPRTMQLGLKYNF